MPSMPSTSRPRPPPAAGPPPETSLAARLPGAIFPLAASPSKRCPMKPLPPARRLASRLGLMALAIAAALVAPRPAAAQAADRVANIVLEDQFKNRRETALLRGDVVVLVYADRKGAEAALETGRRLHVRFHPTAADAPATEWSRQPVVGLPGWPAGVRVPDVHVIPVACVAEVPKAMRPVARARLRKESEFVSVWLDFDDSMRRHFGMVPETPNVAILDIHGRTQATLSGHLDELKFEETVAAITRLRMQARPDARTAALPAALGK